MNYSHKLKTIFKIIFDEAENNPNFNEKFKEVFSDKPKESRRKTHRRSPAAIDPIKVIEEGEEKLKIELSNLDIERLKDIIAEFGMDTSKLAMKWKNKDRLINHIVTFSVQRIKKGDAFR